MTQRRIVNAVKTNLADILVEQVHHLKTISTARTFDKNECVLLKLCMELHDKKLDKLEDILIVSRTIQSDEEKVKLLNLALKN
tara:strand:- start:5105 stop:5353 length:249 start_codon:yes stop_codon:yes gene_type:complete